MARVEVDSSALKKLGADMAAAKRALIGRLAERGYQLLRSEVPVATGNLKQGVAPPEVDYDRGEAVLTVSARSARTAGGMAEVFDSKGERTKTVTLRPQPAYNYAEVVARGNRRATLSPTHAKAFLIPVATRPDGEGYLIFGGQVYVFRKTRRGQRPNPFDERAARRLESEAPSVADSVLRKFL